MLTTIAWIIGGIIAASILIGLVKIFLVVMGVKKMLNIVKTEVEHLPKDYAQMRKEVENENAATNMAKTVGKRWFKHWW
jgi:uncharacterized membrane protein